MHREGAAIVSVRQRKAGLVLAVPQEMGRRDALTDEGPDGFIGLVDERQGPALRLRLGPRVQVDLGGRLLAGRGEHLGLRIRVREEAAESVRETDPVLEAERVILDAVVELVLAREAIGEAA